MNADSPQHRRGVLVFLWAVAFGLPGVTVLHASARRPAGLAQGHGVPTAGLYRTDEPATFRVATFNMRRGKGMDGVRDLKRTAKTLHGFDIIALNEVGGGEPDQAQRLGELLGMGYLFAPAERRWYRDDYGNGFLSRFRVGAWSREPLSGRRSLLRADVRVGRHEIPVLLTHLRVGTPDGSLGPVLESFRRHERAVFMGDLNTRGDSPLLRKLIDSGEALDAIHASVKDDDPARRVDWILTRGLRIVAGGRIDLGASDHPCYWVELAVR